MNNFNYEVTRLCTLPYEKLTPKQRAMVDCVWYQENRNPYKKLSGQWNQYENWFLNAKLREESKDE